MDRYRTICKFALGGSPDRKEHCTRMKTLVFQSAAPHQQTRWIAACLESVQAWALRTGHDYVLLGDEIFDGLPRIIAEKFEGQPVVRSDIARLLMARDFLEEGFDRVIWADADFLIFTPDAFVVPPGPSFAFGREVWVQAGAGGKPRASTRVHNAFFMFEKANPFLDYYIHAALRLLERAEAPVVPQFIGPKFLATQHNLVGFDEIAAAAMFSPLVMRDILNGGGPALTLMLDKQGCRPGGANLSLSHVGREVDGVLIGESDAAGVVEVLLGRGLPG